MTGANDPTFTASVRSRMPGRVRRRQSAAASSLDDRAVRADGVFFRMSRPGYSVRPRIRTWERSSDAGFVRWLRSVIEGR